MPQEPAPSGPPGASIDIVSTIYNDEETLEALVDEIARHVDPIGMPWRLILVCDGSPDGSWAVMERIAAERDNVLIIELSRNFGQHIAASAGLDFTEADYVIVMDSDLQDPPEAIPRIIKELRESDVDIVFVERIGHRASLFKKVTSRMFWRMIRFLSGENIQGNIMMLRGMNRRFVKALGSMRERHRFLEGLSAWIGFKQHVIAFEAGKSLRKRSNYNLRRLIRFAMDATISSSMKPLRMASGLGICAMLFSFFYGSFIVLKHLFWEPQQMGFATLVVLITGLSGVQLLILGIVGEYLGRNLRESQRRPLYLVRQLKGPGAENFRDALPLPPTRSS